MLDTMSPPLLGVMRSTLIPLSCPLDIGRPFGSGARGTETGSITSLTNAVENWLALASGARLLRIFFRPVFEGLTAPARCIVGLAGAAFFLAELDFRLRFRATEQGFYAPFLARSIGFFYESPPI